MIWTATQRRDRNFFCFYVVSPFKSFCMHFRLQRNTAQILASYYKPALMLGDPKRYCWWKQLLVAAELVKCARYTAIMHGVLMTWNLSNYFLKNSSIDLNIPITSDYHCTKKGTLFLTVPCGGVSHHSVSHSDTSKPVLQPSTSKQKSDRFFNLLVHHEHSLHKIYP